MSEVIETRQPVQTRSQKRFELGQVVAAPMVHELIVRGIVNPIELLRRHSSGDWGDLSRQDKALNNASLKPGDGQGRLFSAYQVTPSVTVWVITEWDRSVTTLLLPSEY